MFNVSVSIIKWSGSLNDENTSLNTSASVSFPFLNRFHPSCVNMSSERVNKLKHFFCPDCANDSEVVKQKSDNGTETSFESKV